MTFSSPYISLTFDDGYKSQYTDMLPILEKYGLKGTFYVITGLIGAPHYLNEDQLKELYLRGHEIGSHTVSHRHLTTLKAKTIEWELERSKRFLAEKGISVNTLAYPYGDYLPRVGDICKKYYIAARGCCASNLSLKTCCTVGFNFAHSLNEFCLNAFPTELSAPPEKSLMSSPFSLFKERVKEIVRKTIQRKSWSIFVFHGVPVQKLSSDQLLKCYTEYLIKKTRSPQDIIRITANKARRNLEKTFSASSVTTNVNTDFKLEYFGWLCKYISNTKQIKISTIKDIIETF
jgi:peptidoglycan/xylan/chitin deacetylase (PgdA/CDA1 family)